jgi:hypothetical protein
MAAKKRGAKLEKPRLNRPSGADIVFAELEAMSRDEQEEMVAKLVTWMNDNDLGRGGDF